MTWGPITGLEPKGHNVATYHVVSIARPLSQDLSKCAIG